jgi:hypothetical protein
MSHERDPYRRDSYGIKYYRYYRAPFSQMSVTTGPRSICAGVVKVRVALMRFTGGVLAARRTGEQDKVTAGMAVYKPKRQGVESKYYVCEFVYQGKRFQESTGASTKTVAKEYEKRRRAELERAAAGLPTEQKAARIRTVSGVVKAYLKNYGLTHRTQSVRFAEARLAHVTRLLGNLVLSDLTEDAIHGYIRRRLSDGMAGRTVNMEIASSRGPSGRSGQSCGRR